MAPSIHTASGNWLSWCHHCRIFSRWLVR